MTDILTRIDAATGCQHCEGPLGDSPSGDFCSEWCQRAWCEGRADSNAVAAAANVDLQRQASIFVTRSSSATRALLCPEPGHTILGAGDQVIATPEPDCPTCIRAVISRSFRHSSGSPRFST